VDVLQATALLELARRVRVLNGNPARLVPTPLVLDLLDGFA
jgi:hypothetical protein